MHMYYLQFRVPLMPCRVVGASVWEQAALETE